MKNAVQKWWLAVQDGGGVWQAEQNTATVCHTQDVYQLWDFEYKEPD
jgi:hypothetical protein